MNSRTMLHVTKYDASNFVEFGQTLNVNMIESQNGTVDETVATIYHRKKHLPIVKHLCADVRIIFENFGLTFLVFKPVSNRFWPWIEYFYSSFTST